MPEKNKKLGTGSYKGVRDFFPEDMAVEKAIFDIWRKTSEKYGYEEYGASVLEPAELYRAKSGDEIVNEQTYTFKDRGDREVTLRPEMTPTLARMIASKKRELIFPLRWYSIPNLFRYEQPQRGRTREHWQLNVDLFGIGSTAAEIEVIDIAHDIAMAYGMKDSNFEIRLNNRKTMNFLTKEILGLNEEKTKKISRLIDRKEKMDRKTFESSVNEILGDKTPEFMSMIDSKTLDEFMTKVGKPGTIPGHDEIGEVIKGLSALGINNVRFDQTLMRGFDYYTGIVFEIFDLNPANRRSVFGGGRYDDLLSIFGNDKIPAVGFGAGDLIARDIMETYGHLPSNPIAADVAICIINESSVGYGLALAKQLRDSGLRTVVNSSMKKIGDQISSADKKGIKIAICIGDEEVKSGQFKLKELSTKKEIPVTRENVVEKIRTL